LGVDLVRGQIVVLQQEGARARVTAVATFSPDATKNDLDAVLGEIGVKHREAILAVDVEKTRVGPLPNVHAVPNRLRDQTAQVYAADLIPIVPDGDQIVARFAGASGNIGTIVATLRSEVTRVEARARDLGLIASAVDVPGAAWVRVTPTGIVDLSAPSITLSTPTGLFSQAVVAAPTVGELAANVAQVIANARTQRSYSASTLRVTGASTEHDLRILQQRLGPSPDLQPLVINDRVMPPWALAYGLALWSLW